MSKEISLSVLLSMLKNNSRKFEINRITSERRRVCPIVTMTFRTGAARNISVFIGGIWGRKRIRIKQ